MLPSKWLKNFLASQGLEKPDGRMLFAYRLTQSDYDSLRECLETFTGLEPLPVILNRIGDFSSLFVFYAAEWWRREYQGGDWAWGPIFKAIGGDSQELSPEERSACVRRGLAYWGHAPGKDGMRYVGTIVAQAGLPLNLVSRKDGKLAGLLFSNLRLAGRYGWDESLIQESIAQREKELPHSLRRVEIYRLLAQMIVTALEFRQEFKRSGSLDPVEFLRNEPGWQQRFPLPLGDNQAEVLLHGLVKQASQLETAKTGILSVQRHLRELEPGLFELTSRVLSPRSADAETVATFFGLSQAVSLPRYFSVDVLTTEKAPFAEARQLLGATMATVAFSLRPRQWSGSDAMAEHRAQLRAEAAGIQGQEIPLPGGAEIDPASPWVFARREGAFLFVSNGGARLPDQEAWVSPPKDDGWDLSVEADGVLESAGHVIVGELRRPLYKLQGTASVTGEAETFRVRTGEAVDDGAAYVWVGKRLPFNSVPKAVFMGVPKLYRYNEAGEAERIPDSRIVWRRPGQADPVVDIAALRGPVEARLMEGEEIVARYRFVLASPAAAIRFISGEEETQGQIHLEEWSTTEVVVRPETVGATISRTGRSDVIQLKAEGVPPESVRLHMRWAGFTQDLAVELPFPSTGGRFFDPLGEELRDSTCLTLQDLIGIRLRVFDRNPEKPQRYDVKLQLHSPTGQKGLSLFDSSHPVSLGKDGAAEVRLIDFQKDIELLLSFSRELDAAVIVTLAVGGRNLKSLRIRRYDMELEEEGQQLFLSRRDNQKLLQAQLEQVGLMAFPLAELEAVPASVPQRHSEGVATGAWEVSQLDPAKAPWFLYPDPASPIRFRPTIWAPARNLDEGNDEDAGRPVLTSLAEAMSVADTQQRAVGIRFILGQMAGDFTHSSWGTLEALWRALSHLPLSSMDVWRGLAGQLPALLAALFHFPLQKDELRDLIARFQGELGAILELATLPMWRTTLNAASSAWAAQFGGEMAKQVVPLMLKDKLVAIEEAMPSLGVLMKVLRFEFLGESSEELEEILHSARWRPFRFSEELYSGPDCLLQTVLFRGQYDTPKWPTTKLFEEGLQVLHRAAGPAVKRQLESNIKRLFWKNLADFKSETANMPMLCALWCVTGVDTSWWKEERRLQLQRIRSFDTVWFEQAFSHGLAFAIANRFAD